MFAGRTGMNIILFSKEQSVLENWQNKLKHINSDYFNEVIHCSSFKELGKAVSDENHILLFHLANGNEEEKICYQFITKYQQQHKMIVLVNAPDATQGLRIFRSGVHGYSNTFLDEKKLSVAIDVIKQGRIWVGSETLNALVKNCGLNSKINKQKQKTLLGSVFYGIKKLFN